MTVFEPRTLLDYSERAIVAEIRRVAVLVPGRGLTLAQFERQARVSTNTIMRRFGGWRAALEHAELGHRFAGRCGTPDRRTPKEIRAMGDEALLDELRRIAKLLRRDAVTQADLKRLGRVGPDAYRGRFGSWGAAIRRAGLTPTRGTRRLSDEELFDNLRAVWLHLGRQPAHAEMRHPPSRISSSTYRLRFGGWRGAIAAFIAAESAAVADSAPTDVASDDKEGGRAAERTAAGRAARRRGARTVPLGLRFAVLRRDRYCCSACGRSPATDAGCVLHVDHIVPWSKGGVTAVDNLRALCAECNHGRGNRHADEGGRARVGEGGAATPD